MVHCRAQKYRVVSLYKNKNYLSESINNIACYPYRFSIAIKFLRLKLMKFIKNR